MTSYSASEAATLAGVGTRRVLRLIHAGVIHAEKVFDGRNPFGAFRIPSSEIPKIIAWRIDRSPLPVDSGSSEPRRIAPSGGGLGWMSAAACTTNPDQFHPADTHKKIVEAQEAAAKAICASCPVVDQCLDYALANNEEYGVWGGLTQLERRQIRRQRKETAA